MGNGYGQSIQKCGKGIIQLYIENAFITLNDIATWQSQLTGCVDLSGYVLEETPSTSAISMGIAISIIFIILLIFHLQQEAGALGCGGNNNECDRQHFVHVGNVEVDRFQ